MSNVGEQLVAVRKKKGLSQDAVAKMINVSRASVASWESGRRTPDAETMLRLSEALSYDFKNGVELDPANQSAADPSALPVNAGLSAGNETQAITASPNSPTKPRGWKRILPIAAVLLVLVIAAAILIPKLTAPKMAVYTAEDGTVYTPQSFQQKREAVEGQAYLRFQTSIKKMEGEISYWFFELTALEENGVGFTVERMEEYDFAPDIVARRTYTGEDLKNSGLTLEMPAHGSWVLSGGYPVQKIYGTGIQLYVTDDNGNAITGTTYFAVPAE